ncbi:MAG: hypothetical protein HC872_04225 [Gammaproteobacteria bacterium]|nr:hypothetical protein [Gammaproteobacteria bacterium]
MRLVFITPGILAALLAGCITNVHVTGKPGSTNLSGVYRFAGTGRVRPDQLANPLINWSDIAESSKLELDQRGNEEIYARYTNKSGNLVERNVTLRDASDEAIFRRGELSFKKRIPILDAQIFPGYARQSVGTRFFKDQDGNLRVIGFFTETGLMLFLFPFVDHHEDGVMLEADDP